MTDDLKGMFEHTTPEAPDTDGWADTARRSAHRTSAAWRTGIVTAVIAVTVALPLIATPFWGQSTVGSTPTSEPMTPSVTTKGDPGPTGDSPERPERKPTGDCEALTPQGAVDGQIPLGATQVNMCGTGTTQLAFRPPVQPLTSNLDDLAKWINDRPPFDTKSACTSDAGPAYNLVFTYADGRRAVITVELYGCRTITLGQNELRTGATELTSRLSELWPPVQQARAANPRPGRWCPDSTYSATSFLDPDLRDLRTAKVCRRAGAMPNFSESPVTAADAKTLAADLPANARPDEMNSRADDNLVALSDSRGNLVFVGRSVTGKGYSFYTTTGSFTWNPGPAAANVLHRLIGS